VTEVSGLPCVVAQGTVAVVVPVITIFTQGNHGKLENHVGRWRRHLWRIPLRGVSVHHVRWGHHSVWRVMHHRRPPIHWVRWITHHRHVRNWRDRRIWHRVLCHRPYLLFLIWFDSIMLVYNFLRNTIHSGYNKF